MRVWIVGFSALMLGCGSVVDPGQMGSGASTGGVAGSTSGSAGSTGPITTVGAVTSVGDGPTDGSDSEGGTTSGDEGSSSGSSSTGEQPIAESVCDPQPMGPGLTFMLNDAPIFETQQAQFEGTCTVEAAQTEDELWTIDLGCGDQSFRLALGVPVEPSLQPGNVVELSLFVDSPWWGNGYVKLMRDGVLELAAMDGEALPNGQMWSPPEDFFAPLQVQVETGLCETEEPWTGSFIGKPCTLDRRLGLTFGLGDEQTTILDKNAGSLGDLQLYVGRTVTHEEVTCTDTPGGWREFVAVRG